MNRYRTSLLCLAVLLGTGCEPEVTWSGGTGVGNPGSAQASVARGSDLVIEVATLSIGSFELVRCDGTSERTDVGDEVDLLTVQTFGIAGGQACGLVLEPSGPLVLSGIAGTGDDRAKGTFEAVLDIGPVDLQAPGFVIDGTALIVELGHEEWLDASDLGLQDGTHTQIDAVSAPAVHDDLVTKTELGSGLFVDDNADGQLDGGERDDPLATGPVWSDDDDD